MRSRITVSTAPGRIVPTITEGDVADALGRWIDLDQYIEVRVTPRP